MTAALVAVVVLSLAPAFVTRTVTRGRRAARYGFHDLTRDAVRAWQERDPAAAFDRQAARAARLRHRENRVIDLTAHTPTSLNLRSAA